MTQSRKIKRTRYPRKLSPRVLIIPEGKNTEYYYFTEFKSCRRGKEIPNIIIKRGKGGSAVVTVESAIEERKKDLRKHGKTNKALTYCLIDVEPHSPETQKVIQAIQLANKEKIRIIWSNPSFEIWLLSHKGIYKNAFANPQKVDDELRSIYGKSKSKLDALDMKKLITNNLKSAIQNAKEVREHHHKKIADITKANSSTDIYKLIEYLLGDTKEPP